MHLPRLTETTPVLALALLAAAPSAQSRLFVASPSGSIYSTDPSLGVFELEVDAGESVHALAQIGNRFYLGSPSGAIRTWDPLSGTLQIAIVVPNDVSDLVVYEGDLLASGSDGTVLRVDPRLGTIEETFTSAFAIDALAIDGDLLYTGTPFGVFQTIDLSQDSEFSFAGMCGGPINSMGQTGNELYLGDVTGQVYVYNKTTGFVAYAYPIDNDATAIVRDGNEFLIGGTNGTIRRVTQLVGTLLDTLQAPEAVLDLLLEEPFAALGVDTAALPLSTGGTASFELFAPSVAGDTYLLLGSASGTTPGLSSGSVHLPLNFDGYFKLTLPPFGDEPLAGSFGTFGPAGDAQAFFVLPAGIDPALAGIVLHHAFVTFDSSDPSTLLSGSNATALKLVP